MRPAERERGRDKRRAVERDDGLERQNAKKLTTSSRPMPKTSARSSGTALFEVPTPLGFSVRCTRAYWEFIVTYKHPVMAGREKEIQETLRDPDEVRRSRKAAEIFLFYRGGPPRWLCAVAKRQNSGGVLITAYPTDAIKAGERIWTKSK